MKAENASGMTRRVFLGAAGLAGAAFAGTGAAGGGARCGAVAGFAELSGSAGSGVRHGAAAGFALSGDGRMRVSVPGLKERVRVAFAADTHLGLRDARDDEYADFYARMAQYASKGEVLEKTLKKCAERKTDLVALPGDTISFPTLANAEFVERTLKTSGLEWIYTAGNHDWHFEGDDGSDMEQRERWIKKRLMGLYPAGANPLAHSRVVNGLRVVAIDNSTYEMLPEQTEFWRAEAAKGEPVILVMHIPLWTEGWGLLTCGCPDWGAARDPYWKIERRRRWAEKPSAATMEFRRAVLDTPNLVGVFTGHYHSTMLAIDSGKLMVSAETNMRGRYLEVDFVPGWC